MLTLQILAGLGKDSEALARLPIEAPGVEGYVLGRSGSGSDYLPDIDLAPYGAREKGISRRHAALVQYHGMLHIIDLESTNGTFINGNRIRPNVATQVRSGDVLTLGDLDLRIS